MKEVKDTRTKSTDINPVSSLLTLNRYLLPGSSDVPNNCIRAINWIKTMECALYGTLKEIQVKLDCS